LVLVSRRAARPRISRAPALGLLDVTRPSIRQHQPTRYPVASRHSPRPYEVIRESRLLALERLRDDAANLEQTRSSDFGSIPSSLVTTRQSSSHTALRSRFGLARASLLIGIASGGRCRLTGSRPMTCRPQLSAREEALPTVLTQFGRGRGAHTTRLSTTTERRSPTMSTAIDYVPCGPLVAKGDHLCTERESTPTGVIHCLDGSRSDRCATVIPRHSIVDVRIRPRRHTVAAGVRFARVTAARISSSFVPYAAPSAY
jgi:hypothetical protein